jgi:CDGSH-type Zn-finger protein
VKFELAQAEKVALCGCKRTATKPFCDGTHKKL